MSIQIAGHGAEKIKAAIAAKERRIKAGHDRIVRAWGKTIQAAERRYARDHHRKTGRFAAHIKTYVDRPGEGKVKATGPIAHLVLSPTAAHEITPKSAQALVVGAQPVESVHHPGTPGDNFLRRVADEAKVEAMLAAREEYLHGI